MLNGLKNSKVYYENQKENNTVKYLKPESDLQPVFGGGNVGHNKGGTITH